MSNNTETPEIGPSEEPPSCTMEISEPFNLDGKLMKTILSRHSDGFVCLRFTEVEAAETTKLPSPYSGRSIWHNDSSD